MGENHITGRNVNPAAVLDEKGTEKVREPRGQKDIREPLCQTEPIARSRWERLKEWVKKNLLRMFS